MDNQRIRQLPPEVIGQIAAGEVVERPAAAIKELVENALDAGATSVSVDIREGGVSYFKVTDNGKGILPQDIRLAFARHATSKIATAQDIYGIKTMGFRGEALASIAAVSVVKMTTRARGEAMGISVKNEGGVLGEIQEAACSEGTTITVTDLFYNAPVRKKFLKKTAMETAAVTDVITRVILSHPEVSFRFRADGKNVFFSAGDGKTESAVMCIWGLDTLKKLHKIDGCMNGMIVSGYVGTGELSRGNRSQQYFFINGRMMKSAFLTRALESACVQRVMIGRFPVCVLSITMPYENVDVNVHPNKWEVRFQDEKQVLNGVQAIISDCLAGENIFQHMPALFDTSATTPGNAPKPDVKIKITDSFTTGESANMPAEAGVLKEPRGIPAVVNHQLEAADVKTQKNVLPEITSANPGTADRGTSSPAVSAPVAVSYAAPVYSSKPDFEEKVRV